MFLSPFRPFPLARPERDPLSDLMAAMSPFSLLPSPARLGDAFPMSARIEAGDGKALNVVFDGMEYEQVDVSVDEKTNSIVVEAQNEAGTARATRMVSLPFPLQECDKITAQRVGDRVVVAVPAECQKAPPELGGPEPKPLKVSLRPAEAAPTPEFETSEDDVGFTIKVLGIAKGEEPSVRVDGSKILVTCKAAEGDTPFSRVFALPRSVKDADEITAKVEEDRLVVSVPHHALEVEKEPAKAQIAVAKSSEAALPTG